MSMRERMKISYYVCVCVLVSRYPTLSTVSIYRLTLCSVTTAHCGRVGRDRQE